MRASLILVIVLIFALAVDDTSAWRRRRRRRSCGPTHCGYNWSAWTGCPVCGGTRSRYPSIWRHPSCGGSGCPGTQTQTCYGTCVAGAGYCSGGRCQCNAGRTGSRCESTCGANRYGVNCANTCNCPTGCNPVSGVCNCVPSNCEHSWNPWSTCDCNNKQTRTMVITKEASCGGAQCPTERSQTQNCEGSCLQDGGLCQSQSGLCQCFSGRHGRRCELECSNKTYGFACARKCDQCTNGCDSKTGECKHSCAYTWSSWSNCDCLGKQSRSIMVSQKPSGGGSACPMSPTSDTCNARVCNSTGGGYCNTKTGECECYAGRNGTTCDKTCPNGTFGVNCVRKCPESCPNGCDSKTGECILDCKYSWSPWTDCDCMGKRTRKISVTQQAQAGGSPCPNSPQLEECEARVCVEDGGYCSTASGDCHCYAGRNGTTCDEKCPLGTFDVNCVRKCPETCPNGCDSKTGECILHCQYTWSAWTDCDCTGKRTRKISITQQVQANGRPCPSSPQNEMCKARVCDNEGGICDKTCGHCQCFPGRNGTTCNEKCAFGRYGVNCVHKCENCTTGCDSKTGVCNCVPVSCISSWSAWSNCTCMGTRTRVLKIERPAFCNGTACPSKIKDTISCIGGGCVKGGVCNSNTGVCNCPPGLMGPRCEQCCPEGRYGYNCAFKCDCQKGSTCDSKTGHCSCVNGRCIDIKVNVNLNKKRTIPAVP